MGLGSLGDLVVSVKADTSQFNNKLQGLGNTAKILGGAIAGAISIAAIKKLADASIQLAKTGAEVEGVTKAFEGLTASIEGGSDKMLSALQKGALGMVDNTTLMKNFNSAAQLIGKDFAQTLPDAMQYFTKISASTGESVDYLMDSYIRGIGRLSPMIIDNLKIQVTQAEATKRASEMYGVAEGALSKYQIQMGMASVVTDKLAESTASLPEVAGTAAQSFAAFQTTMTNLKDRLAVTVLPLFTEIMNSVMTALDSPEVKTAIENFFSGLGKVIGNTDSGVIGVFTALTQNDIAGALEAALGENASEILAGFGLDLETLNEDIGTFKTRWSEDWDEMIVYVSDAIFDIKLGIANLKVFAAEIRLIVTSVFEALGYTIDVISIRVQNDINRILELVNTVIRAINTISLIKIPEIAMPEIKVPYPEALVGGKTKEAYQEYLDALHFLEQLKANPGNVPQGGSSEVPNTIPQGIFDVGAGGGTQPVVYNNYGIDLGNQTKAQELLNPFIDERVRQLG